MNETIMQDQLILDQGLVAFTSRVSSFLEGCDSLTNDQRRSLIALLESWNKLPIDGVVDASVIQQLEVRGLLKNEPESDETFAKDITDAQIREIAKQFNLEPAVVHAVLEVESSGDGFLPDGRPKILFEAQWFGKFTGDIYNDSHPDISKRYWDRNQYVGGAGEWDRFDRAAKLDKIAACKAASWGLGQVMGLNFLECGCATVQKFVELMCRSEMDQFILMMNFIKSKGLIDELQRKDWAGFAYVYNGSGYAENRYDERLHAAYVKHAGAGADRGDVFIDIAWFPQTDNYTQAGRTCFSSTCAMLLEWWDPSIIADDNDYLRRLIEGGYGDTTLPQAQLACLESFGVRAEYRQTGTFDLLDEEFDAGRPVGMGMLHRGTRQAPRGGHWFCARGRKGANIIYANDPYGSVNDGYTKAVENGRSVGYSRDMLHDRWYDPKGYPTGGFVMLMPPRGQTSR